MVPLILLGGLGLGVLWLIMHPADASKREIWLINGKRYAVVHRIHGPGWDASMYPGFCNFSEPVITGQPSVGVTEVQFEANWCTTNTLFQAPPEMAISEVS